MNQIVNPKSVHKPLGAYSHSVRIARDAELLFIAGQVGMDANAKLQDGVSRTGGNAVAMRKILSIDSGEIRGSSYLEPSYR